MVTADEALRGLHAQGVSSWPAIDLALERFVAHVKQVAPSGLAPDAIALLSGEGLTLAAACLEGQPAAISIFDSVYLTPLDRVLRKLDGGSELAAETIQGLRAQFLVERPSAFLSYSGRGALSVWLKVIAVRAAQKLRRGTGNAPSTDDELTTLPAPEADPELRFMKLQHRAHFKASFQAALGSLGARERSVLRMSLVEGLSIDDIGRVYDVHRATAARWLTSARELLVSSCRTRLAEQLKISEAELDEMMGTVQSNLSISLSSLVHQR